MSAGDLHTLVGKSVPRIDGIEKVTGAARFTGDLVIPDMLDAKVVRSPYPHALIESIDVSEAMRLPGVGAILTRDDLQDINPYYGNCLRDRPLLALDRVRFVGEPVAAAAAIDKTIAEEAASLVKIRYRELASLSTVGEAMAEGAPVLHEKIFGAGEHHEMESVKAGRRKNICHEEHLERGEVGKGFAESDEVFEEVYEFPMVCHSSMEPHTAIASVDRYGITLWSSSAHPFLVRAELAQMFGFPLSKVRVVVPYVGGAFGGKSYFKIEPLVVALARKAGRPVRLIQSGSESMLTNRRHSARCRIKTGVKRDGTLVAREAELFLDTGAYADNGPRVASRAVTRLLGPYHIRHYRINVSAVYTNTVPAGSMRSIGGPQSIWAVESHMDVIAERLGLDPLEFRLNNLLRRGEELKPGGRPIDADLAQGLEKAASMVDWRRRSRAPGRGLGLALGLTDSEAMPVSTAIVRLLADGSILLNAGTTEVGQGARTVLSQIVAEELYVPIERVTMHGTDTLVTPFDRSTGASRSTTVMGTAVRAAAIDLRKQLTEAAAEILKVSSDRIVCRDGELIAGEKRLDYGKAVRTFFGMSGGELIGRGYVRPGGALDSALPVFWETGMGAADIEVDSETGEIRLKTYATVADVGLAINPQQCESQDEGAALMGIGHTLFESLHYDSGQPINPNLIDYHVPTVADIPDNFESALIENRDGPGPYGIKGMGESGVVSVAPAVANALAQATGARIRELPLTPERVWRALKRARPGSFDTAPAKPARNEPTEDHP
ncbi:MAG: xanthine dehydrogenase family protein molybdopterin-binding subunit [Deltaproteobacteria bacterium]|nr:xanthine dehydrogenase family protein molybdopterin-binding subunit [Deltaproteobacteria bacterium]